MALLAHTLEESRPWAGSCCCSGCLQCPCKLVSEETALPGALSTPRRGQREEEWPSGHWQRVCGGSQVPPLPTGLLHRALYSPPCLLSSPSLEKDARPEGQSCHLLHDCLWMQVLRA